MPSSPSLPRARESFWLMLAALVVLLLIFSSLAPFSVTPASNPPEMCRMARPWFLLHWGLGWHCVHVAKGIYRPPCTVHRHTPVYLLNRGGAMPDGLEDQLRSRPFGCMH